MRQDAYVSFDDPITTWFRRAVALTGTIAERTQSERVQQRAWHAAGARGSAELRTERWAASDVPATDHLRSIERPGPDADGVDGLLRDLQDFSPRLPWKPSDRLDDGGTDVALVELTDCLDVPLPSAGIMLLGPEAGYPEHRHPPEEVYLVLSGSRRWRFGGSDRYLRTDPGQVLSNSANDPHAVEAGPDALVAVWFLVPGSVDA